jgi:predicted transcriptional regulator
VAALLMRTMTLPPADNAVAPDRISRRLTVADAMLHAPKLSEPGSTVGDLRRLFLDDHVHAALIVADGGLVCVVYRADLHPVLPDREPAARVGDLGNRVVRGDEPLDVVKLQMISNGRRRLAVVDDADRLMGLLCLKRSLSGFCSDDDVRCRANDESGRGSLPSGWST